MQTSQQPQTLDLSGRWQLRLDPHNLGLAESWHTAALPDAITLPGSLPGHGIGNPVSLETPWMAERKDHPWHTYPQYAPYRRPDNFKIPFWLQPETYYAGAAWYQRTIRIPESWQGRRILLTLERPHWQTDVWLDARHIGRDISLSTPHHYELPADPGEHTLTLRVDNSLIVDVGINSHSISDHTQGNWNGVVGQISLTATDPTFIRTLDIFPDAAHRRITIRAALQKPADATMPSAVHFRINGASPSTMSQPGITAAAPIASDGTVTTTLDLGPTAQLWDEFSPALYRLTATLPTGESASTTFGLRDITTRDTRFILNGRPIYFRGTLECCVFPRTGHPPTDLDSWRKVLRAARDHGLNMIRFHSWCPPEAAFAAADELGMYLQLEAGSWANTTTTLGDGKPIDTWIYSETERILRAYGNHPSFLLMAYGNEPAGKHYKEFLGRWIHHFQPDTRRIFTSAAGWPEIPENHFHIDTNPRIQAWGAELTSRINAKAPETRTDYRDYIQQRSVPIISHEIGQWCVYPSFAEMSKYTGYLKPRNFEIFQQSLADHHMADQAHDFLIASGKLQTLCYKEEIESALRTPGMGGFQLLGLNDFPGQGTALVGVLDPFWESKGYVTAEEFHRFSGSIVPLARLDRRVFTADQSLRADIDLAHFGPDAIPADHPISWQLRADDGAIIRHGQLPHAALSAGALHTLGSLDIDLTGIPTPARYKLVIGIGDTNVQNDWDIWIYPSTLSTTPPANVHIALALDAAALATLDSGGRVLLLLPPDQLRGDDRGPVGLGFSSIFWNTAWTSGQKPHTLGLLCDPAHPAFAHFPTDFHTNWQWWYILHNAGAMLLDTLPTTARPILQVIDDWFTNRKLGLIFEATVGRGKILICSADLQTPTDPVTRQLLHSLLHYASSPHFTPHQTLTPTQIAAIT